MKIIKSFCRGPGGGFFKKSPLAAGGKKNARRKIEQDLLIPHLKFFSFYVKDYLEHLILVNANGKCH